PAIAVGVDVDLTSGVFPGVRQEPGHAFDNEVVLSADQFGGAGFQALGPLRRIAHDQDRLPQRGRFLLHAARVGQDDARAGHQPNELWVGGWWDQMNIRPAPQEAVDWLLDVGVQVHGVDERAMPEALAQRGDGPANLVKARAEVFPAVPGDEDERPAVEHGQVALPAEASGPRPGARP